MPNPYLLEFTNGQNAHKNSNSQVNLNNGKTLPSASFGNRSKQTNSNIVLPTNQNVIGTEPKNRKKSESIDVGKNNMSKPNNQHMQYTNYSSNNSTHIQSGTQKQIRQNMKNSLRNSHNKSIGAVPESMVILQQ